MNNDAPFWLPLVIVAALVGGLVYVAWEISTCLGDCPPGKESVYVRASGCVCVERPR